MIKFYPKLLLVALCGFLQMNAGAKDGQPVVSRNEKDNTVKTVLFSDNDGPLADNGEAVLRELLELGSEYALTLKFADTQKNGTVIQRYNLVLNGIKAEHGAIAVMYKYGRMTFVNANIYKAENITATTPVLAEAQALEYALDVINAEEYAWENAQAFMLSKNDKSYQYPAGTLVWVEDFNTDVLNKRLRPAYRFDILASQPMSRDRIYIDAVSGKLLLRDAVMKHVNGTGTTLYSGNVNFEVATLASNLFELYDSARVIATYNMNNSTNLSNATEIQNSTPNFGKSVAIDAHWGATVVYDYWKKEHNRSSFDDAGSPVISLINYGNNYNNAAWTGTYMIYGNGTGMFNTGFEPLVSLDVCAHELGHGICEYTAGLVYRLESGALNEGFSDIWGAVVEKYAAVGKDMWAIGEELRMGALRSMSNPNLFNNPDTRGGAHWTNVIGCNPTSGNDWCGVHNNSGVLNHWFYLLTDGGKGTNDLGNAFEISGLGMKKAAQIAYATEQLLGPTDGFDACRSASIGVAANMFGPCSREVEAVTRAWHAVGVGAAFSPCAPQIGFAIGDTIIVKSLPQTICPMAQLVSIPMRVTGGAPMGGNATVTVSAAGSLTNGVDYTILNSPVFNGGSTTNQNVNITIADNGDVTKDRVLKLYFAIAQNGSNAITSYTYDTCFVLLKGEKQIPDTGGMRISQVNTGSINSKAVTPFFSRNQKSRMQFVLSADELVASGLKAGDPVTTVQFNVTEKNSTKAYTDFTLKINPTGVTNLNSGVQSASTVYYNGNYSTQLGWNNIPLSTPFIWNGTDNLVFETCFNNTSTDPNNDYIQAFVGKDVNAAVRYTNSGTGCNLAYTGTGYFTSISKPTVRFLQPTDTAKAETIISGSRQWDVNPGHKVYFTDTLSGKLIADINNTDSSIGCTNVSITKQGNGFAPMSGLYTGIGKSNKEFTLMTSKAPAMANYSFALYFDTSELSAANLANVRILATTVTHDSLMDTSNSVVVMPVRTQVQGYHTFKGSFSKLYTTYVLVDNNLVVPNPKVPPTQNIAGWNKANGNISVVNNPFTDRILVNYNLGSNTKASIRLYDITGKQLYVAERELDAQQHRFEINLSDRLLVPGNYILQVVTGSDVMTQKIVKQ